MIFIARHYKGVRFSQKWFSEKTLFSDCLKIMIYKQLDLGVKTNGFFIKKYFYTLHSDLTLTEESILKKFSSTIRNEINRSEREEYAFNSSELKEEFITIYNEFASQRGIASVTLEKLNDYKENLVLTSSSINGVITAVHSYLVDFDNRRVRLLHSGTLRFSERIDRNMIARSNKFLHFKDMQKFKMEGFLIYDWGGIAYETEDKALQGINKFKGSFGGELIKQKELSSLFYYLILKIFK